VRAEAENPRRTEQLERVVEIDLLDVAQREIRRRRLDTRTRARDVVPEVAQRRLDARVHEQIASMDENAGHPVSVPQCPVRASPQSDGSVSIPTLRSTWSTATCSHQTWSVKSSSPKATSSTPESRCRSS
jgi:hypothetical protein